MVNTLIVKQLEILGHEEGKEFTEIRSIPSGKSKFCKSFAEVGLAVSKQTNEEGLYIGINPRQIADGHATSVNRLTCIVVDIDPVRPKETASTDEQHRGAIELGIRISEDFGGGVVVSSGSGCHVYFPTEPIIIKDREALSKSLKEWNDAVKKQYSTKEYKIDSIWDLSRVIRVWGSVNHRSNRPCEVVSGLDRWSRFNWVFNQEPKEIKTTHEPSSETEERLGRLVQVNPRLKALVEGSASFESPSEYDFAFVSLLAKAHFSVEEIKSLYHHNVHGNDEPKKGDVERIVKKVLDEESDNSYSLIHSSKSYFDGLSGRKMGARTGISSLDEMLSGLKEGKLYIFAARPNQGKTTLSMQILTKLAEDGLPCLMFPTEVGAEPLIDKIISRKTGISLKKFQNGTFTEQDKKLIDSTREYIGSLPLVVVEDFGIGVDKLISDIDKFAPRVVCLDYFQALKWNNPESVGEKESAVHKLKKITQDRKLITLVMSQLKRGDGGKANLSELKGTGALEELADVVGQMYRVEELGVYPVKVDLTITKSKYSSTGNIPLRFWSSSCKFEEEIK